MRGAQKLCYRGDMAGFVLPDAPPIYNKHNLHPVVDAQLINKVETEQVRAIRRGVLGGAVAAAEAIETNVAILKNIAEGKDADGNDHVSFDHLTPEQKGYADMQNAKRVHERNRMTAIDLLGKMTQEGLSLAGEKADIGGDKFLAQCRTMVINVTTQDSGKEEA